MASNGKIDFNIVKTASRDKLSRMLDDINGDKAIVWEKELAGTFGLVGDFSYLRSHGVSQMFYLNDKFTRSPEKPATHMVFITKPNTSSMGLVNKYIRGMEANETLGSRELHLWIVPRISLLCERRLQEDGVKDYFTSITDLPLFLFKMESDLVSMELPDAFKECALSGSPGSVHLAARALMLLQGLFGPIPNITGKGPNVRNLYNMMMELRREVAHRDQQVQPKIDQLIIIDRSVDLITPLTTPLTYEGLIDQRFNITNCTVKIPTNKLPGSSEEESLENNTPATKPVTLSSADNLYAELRDCNFTVIGPKLAAYAKMVTKEYEERHQAKSMVEMHQFVQKLPRIGQAKESISLHTSLSEPLMETVNSPLFRSALMFEHEMLRGSVDLDKVSPFLEECLYKQEPMYTVLRLICLQSVLNNGFKPKLYEFYVKELIQSYGYHHFLTIDNLKKAGLLTVQQQKSNYVAIRKTLRLIVDDVNEKNPTDIAYVHSGYAPLSIRLSRFVHSPGWRAITDLLNMLPGETVVETQHSRHKRPDGGNVDEGPPVVLVFFLGGCTYSEIAALRFLTENSNGGSEYVIATTSIISGNKFLRSLSHPLLKDDTSDLAE